MKPDEAAFEDFICDSLVTAGGYRAVKVGTAQGAPADYDPTLGLDTPELFAFIGATQADPWEKLVKLHGGADQAQAQFLKRLAEQLDGRGTVDVLRHGVVDHGVTIQLAYFRPAHRLTPELVARFDANRLTVTRQLPYEADSNKTLDLCLLVNGLPVATAELKNPLTGQTVDNAIAQYRNDRDPNNVTLSKRAVVHFAVDTERVAMTTRLQGKSTMFLPFNQGDAGGAGNPANPGGHRTSYLWEDVWSREAWIDILHRFIAEQKPSKGSKTKGVLIFPRFHQWDAVLTLEAATREQGSGHSYLVQHSAGSGKSNTIGWLAHRLVNLHDESDSKVFDKVVIITDRVVLDRQLQETVYQFEHAHGVVERVDGTSAQLRAALEGEQAKIIITTLQKFPVVLEQGVELPDRRYAVIVDEAHSSQTGEAAKDLKLVLGDSADDAAELAAAELEDVVLLPEPEDPVEEALAAQVKARGKQPNLSFFAFTATPKARTLELFGTPNPEEDGKYFPFHRYPMRQAIEEGFILDVLANYTTYDMYLHLEKAVRDDPRYETKEAKKALARFIQLHPENVAQKAEIIVEHFREHVAHKIGGHAKAMVVTSSRLHAVRYKQALDAHINEHGYNLGVLVAFSGTVTDHGVDLTESNMNQFADTQTAKRFEDDDNHLLVVAEKFQTGFDQPLLYAMYVDKPLSGLAAVQTLSRLNRIYPSKDGTFVLDFRNTADDIYEAFEPYYGTTVAPPTEPNLLYDTRSALDEYGVLWPEDAESLAKLILAGGNHGRVHAVLTPAVDRFHSLEEEEQDEFRDALGRFIRIYSFLSQVVSFGDTKLEKDFLFCRALAPLIREEGGSTLDLSEEVELTHLRYELTHEGAIPLDAEQGEVISIFEGRGRATQIPEEPLSTIIEALNERFGTQWTDADRLFVDAIAEDMANDPAMQLEAGANPIDAFSVDFDESFLTALAKRLDRNEDVGFKILDDHNLRAELLGVYLPLIYGKARVKRQEYCPVGELIDRGEDQYLEYKSTLRWDIKQQKKSKLIESATIKTVAAFLNSHEGGTLLIGVADDSDIVGLNDDYASLHKDGKDDADLFSQHLTNILINSIGKSATSHVTGQLHHLNGDSVCRVHVNPSPSPVMATVTVEDKNGQQSKVDKFFVRLNNATHSIDDPAEQATYKADHWGIDTEDPDQTES